MNAATAAKIDERRRALESLGRTLANAHHFLKMSRALIELHDLGIPIPSDQPTADAIDAVTRQLTKEHI